MPYQTIVGERACGECKIKVLSGEFDQGFVMDMALSQEDELKTVMTYVYGKTNIRCIRNRVWYT